MIHFPIDWIEKLRNWMQTMAFALGISAFDYAMLPDQNYGIVLTFSVCIASACWFLIDFGRHFYRSATPTGWPAGMLAPLHTIGGNVAGFVLGNLVASAVLGLPLWRFLHNQALVFTIAMSVGAGLLISYYFYSRYTSEHLHNQVIETQAQASQAKLKLLQTQLDPHLLFNTLANLRALISIDPDAALKMLDRMDTYLRATLSASRATEHPLADEFARLEDYLELMKIRMGERLQYTLDLPSNLAHIAVPSLILQPLVENSIKHGLEPQIAGGNVDVRARWLNGKLQLQVADTGVGLAPDQLSKAAAGSLPGFGMAQLGERLRTRFGDDVAIECLANTPQGTCVNMLFSVTT